MRQNRGNTVVQVDNWLICALFLSDKRWDKSINKGQNEPTVWCERWCDQIYRSATGGGGCQSK